MTKHKINDNVTLITDDSGKYNPENLEVRVGKELFDWKNAPREVRNWIVKMEVIQKLKESSEAENTFEEELNEYESDENTEFNDAEKAREPEIVEAELVEEPESLRAKAHRIEQPIKPLRTPGIKPSRMIKNLNPVLMECGKIKIGGKGETKKSRNGNDFRAPVKFDHFVVTTMNKTENGDFEPDTEIMGKLGFGQTRKPELQSIEGDYEIVDRVAAGPTRIPVRLPHDSTELNFPTCYAYYDSAKCQCRGDGEIAVTAEGETIECNPETCKHFGQKKCKPNGVLSVILDDAPMVGGVYKFRTTSWNSINNLIASMEFIRRLTNGMLAGLPLMLTLTPKHTTIPGTKMPTTIYMVNLEYRGSLAAMAEARREALETRKMMKYSIEDFEKLAIAELEAPEDPEEAKDIQEEFYPE